MIKTNNIICFVDYNGLTNLKKNSNLENHMQYINLCKICGFNSKQLLGESFILSDNKNYYNLFCLINGQLNKKYLEKSIKNILKYNYLKHLEFHIKTKFFKEEEKIEIIEIFKKYKIKVDFI